MTDELSLEPGSLFAQRYKIIDLLGQGDRKRTYLAHDTKFDRKTALCIVRPETLSRDPDGTKREAKILSIIGHHDNIVALYDINIDTPYNYMAFEYLGGGTLADLILRFQDGEERFTIEQFLKLARQLCRALSHVHNQGFLHRDVSPANIWFDERHEAHLGDFDSAIALGESNASLPITTNSYASPEEINRGELGIRSDLYSLGQVFRFTVEESGLATKARIPKLESLISKLIEPDPYHRPASAEDVLNILRTIDTSESLESILARGEGEQVEFKSSLFHLYQPLDSNKPQDRDAEEKAKKADLIKTVLKTIAAFLNSKGGALLIGVSDTGKILGIEADFKYLVPKREEDFTDLWLRNLEKHMKSCFCDMGAWAAINIRLEKTNEGTVAIVSCNSRDTETWLKINNVEEFYIRTTSSSQPLAPRDAAIYIREHFPVGSE